MSWSREEGLCVKIWVGYVRVGLLEDYCVYDLGCFISVGVVVVGLLWGRTRGKDGGVFGV